MEKDSSWAETISNWIGYGAKREDLPYFQEDQLRQSEDDRLIEEKKEAEASG